MLVCERRERLGGAATLERPFADQRYVVSPCAYLVGLLDEVVISELELERRGYRVTPADPNLWCPFADGSSYAAFIDSARTAEYLREQGFAECRHPRPGGVRRACSTGSATCCAGPGRRPVARAVAGPRRDRALLGDDPELIGLVFDESIASMLERYVDDPRLIDAIACRGRSGPSPVRADPGTASIRLMHHQGDLLGLGSYWGYVDGRARPRVVRDRRGGARGRGAQLAAGVPVAAIVPGEGVELESGERIRAPIGDLQRRPEAVLAMLDDGARSQPTTAPGSRPGRCARR